MAGHSKWANIKHKKEANDAQRSNAFTKMSRLITSAVLEGGGIGDPDKNFRLRLAVERARAVNMPKDTIQRAIDKGTGAGAGSLKELVYEAFGPGGTAFIITAITDNSNRTLSEIKSLLDKNGGKLANQNAVTHLFLQCGVLELDKAHISEERAFEMLEELQGTEFEETDEAYIIYIPFENVGKARSIIGNGEGQNGFKSFDVCYVPLSPIVVEPDVMNKVEHLSGLLEDHDDVQNVYCNV